MLWSDILWPRDRHWRVMIVTLYVVLFGIFIWPTPWRYVSTPTTLWRIHRGTGCYQQALPTGWDRNPNHC